MNPKASLSQNDAELSALQKVMDFFNLGSFEDGKRLSNGRTHASYLVRDGNNREWVVRVLSQGDSSLLENQDVIQGQLTACGIRTNNMVKNEYEEHLYSDGCISATVSRKLKGEHPTGTELECELVGATLAQFHVGVNHVPNANNNMLLCSDRVMGYLELMREKMDVGRVEKLLGRFTKDMREGLPTGIIHGDLHRDNVLIDGQDIAILDMDSSGPCILLLDIARSMADLCRSPEGMDTKKLAAYLRGYTRTRKLTKKEEMMLPAALSHTAGIVALWFYAHNDSQFGDEFARAGEFARTIQKPNLLV